MTGLALVIDDNMLNLETLELLLKREGMDTLTMLNPKALPETLDEVADDVRVIFLDLTFPTANGFDILQTLKADARLVHVPIVAYTVHISELQEAQDAGFHSFLGKPLDTVAFPGQLRRILRGERVWEVGQ